jgi:AraC-like DNA-binding protein
LAPLTIELLDIRNIAPHYHDDALEILYCLSGSVGVSFGYERHALRAGKFVAVDHDIHTIHASEPNITVSFLFDLKDYDSPETSFANMYFVCPHETNNAMLDGKLEMLNRLLVAILLSETTEANPSLRRARMETCRTAVMNTLLRYFSIISYCSDGAVIPEGVVETLIRIVNYLIRNHKNKISLEDIAALAHLNKNYASQFMGKYLPGYTEWLNFIRASMSTRLLIETNMNVDAVSEEMGFSDKKYYYGAFEKWFSCTPSEYRKEYRAMSERKDDYKTLSPAAVAPVIQSVANRLCIEQFLDAKI